MQLTSLISFPYQRGKAEQLGEFLSVSKEFSHLLFGLTRRIKAEQYYVGTAKQHHAEECITFRISFNLSARVVGMRARASSDTFLRYKEYRRACIEISINEGGCAWCCLLSLKFFNVVWAYLRTLSSLCQERQTIFSNRPSLLIMSLFAPIMKD